MNNKSLLLPAFLSLSATLCGQTGSTGPAFACDRSALSAPARKRHFDELGPGLRALVLRHRELPNGYEFGFRNDASTYALVTEWAGGEHLCCPFFDIDVLQEHEKGTLWIRLTGGAGVKQFIQADFAKWMSK